MFCSGCGQALAPGQAVCSQCGRPVAMAVPPVPGFELQLASYRSKVKALAVVWFIYAAFSVLVGVAGVTFLHGLFSNHFGMMGRGPWGNGSTPPDWIGPMVVHFVWAALLVRAALAVVAGWGLLERAQWGRIVAIVAAVLSLLKFPFGTALGIWTLVMLLGYRNTTLYEQLP